MNVPKCNQLAENTALKSDRKWDCHVISYYRDAFLWWKWSSPNLKLTRCLCLCQLWLSLILNTWAPQGCLLSPLLYSLFTNDFLSVHITDNLKWSIHTDSVVKKSQQRLVVKKCAPKNFTNFYRCTIESNCITACTAIALFATAQSEMVHSHRQCEEGSTEFQLGH